MATIDELYQQYLLSQQPPLGESSTTLTPYQRIMAQMTPTMNPYTGAGVAIGGYDPALYRRMSGSGLINFGGGGFGGGGGEGNDPYSDSNPDWSSKTDAERAAYYSENPFMAGVTQLGQKALGFTSLGALAKAMNPDLWGREGLITMGVNPAAYQAAKESFRASEIADMNGGFQGYAPSTETGVGNPGESYGGQTSSESGVGNPGESGSSDSSSGGDGTSSGAGTDSGGDGWAKGGKVTKDRLKGPDPKGPDQGYGALLDGEYVIKKSAVNKYGTGLLDMINNGKIPAKKMKSLLG
jgi:hypothetical protein